MTNQSQRLVSRNARKRKILFLTLPVMEARAGRAFPVAFTAGLAVLFAGGILLAVRIRGELKSHITGLSIKQAMDSLASAVLFYQKNGYIIMQNNKMQELMLQSAGRVFYNGKLFLETAVIPNAEHTGLDSYLYRIGDRNESVWLFTVRELIAGGKTVTRLTAADVTEQDSIITVLRRKQTVLKDRQEQLWAFVNNIEEICRTEELLRIKNELHDAHNTKLATLLQYLHYGELPAGESFDDLRESVLRGMKEPETVPASEETLNVLIEHYGRKGVNLRKTGSLPPEQDIAFAFIQIFREAVANAVIHGYANEVTTEITYDDDTVTMSVTDNGAASPKAIKEGGGVTNMRRQIEKLGGTLEISVVPRFTITATVPVASVSVKSGA